MKHVVLLDNFDSFTFNLVNFFEMAGARVTMYRNDIFPEQIHLSAFDLLVISPGPSIPKNAGNLMRILERSVGKIPIFGVCLGHEALVELFGGSLRFVLPVHGKNSPICHDGKTIFSGLRPRFLGGRYHSLAADRMPADVVSSAVTEDGINMAMRHKTLPIESVQFHPESVLTMKHKSGFHIVKNVLSGLAK